MDIASIHDFIFFVLRKEQNAIISHEQVDDALHAAQMSRFGELLPAKSEPGQQPAPLQQVEYGTTTNSMDYLFNFKKKFDFSQDETPLGMVSLPSDYAHLRAVYTLSYNNKYERTKYVGIPILSENQLAERLSSQIINPTCDRPVGIMVYEAGKKIQLYPQQPFFGRCYYFSIPVKPKYAYTTDGRTITQNIGDSVGLLWDDESTNLIMYKALQILGVNLQFPMVIQWSQYKEQKQG